MLRRRFDDLLRLSHGLSDLECCESVQSTADVPMRGETYHHLRSCRKVRPIAQCKRLTCIEARAERRSSETS